MTKALNPIPGSNPSVYSPARYAGMVQSGMWLLRPRVVREFHIPEEFRARDRWFLLDTNLDAPRPWTFVPPKLGKLTPGGFVEPQHPWEQTTKIPVYSLALVKGQSPQRRWLLYGHSPWGPRKSVEVT